MLHAGVSRSKRLLIKHDGVAGNGLERQGSNELAGGAGHNRHDIRPRFRQASQHLNRFERSDAAADTEDDRLAFKS
jgi:hypothetical protein